MREPSNFRKPTISTDDVWKGMPRPSEQEADYPVKPSRIAAYIVGKVIANQTESNWITYFDEIESRYASLEGTGWKDDTAFLDAIEAELRRYPQFEDNAETAVYRKGDDGYFDCCAWTDYIEYEYEDEDEEE